MLGRGDYHCSVITSLCGDSGCNLLQTVGEGSPDCDPRLIIFRMMPYIIILYNTYTIIIPFMPSYTYTYHTYYLCLTNYVYTQARSLLCIYSYRLPHQFNTRTTLTGLLIYPCVHYDHITFIQTFKVQNERISIFTSRVTNLAEL